MEQVKEYSFIFNSVEHMVTISKDGEVYAYAVRNEAGEVISEDSGFETVKIASDKANYSISVPSYL